MVKKGILGLGLLLVAQVSLAQPLPEHIKHMLERKEQFDNQVAQLLIQANQGKTTPLIKLGDLFAGKGMYTDYKQARFWYTEAQKKGVVIAAARLQKLDQKARENSNED